MGACTKIRMNVSAERLVSEELKSRYGDIVLEITQQDAVRRIGCLRRAKDNAVLTYHVVTFYPKGVRAMGRFHKEIVAGKLMGETIKHSGIPHVRHVSPPGVAPMPDFLRALFKTKKKKCRMQILNYTVRGKRYAHIEECYNPQFVPLREIRPRQHLAQTPARTT